MKLWGLLSALLSGAILAVSRDTGHLGWFVLIGPVPLLIYAARAQHPWRLFGLALLTGVMAEAGPMVYYGKVLPLIYAIAIFQGLLFALTVLFFRSLYNRNPATAVLGFGAMTAGSEYLYAVVSPNGSFGALGYALVDVLPLLQTASLGGVPLLSFLAALIPAGLAVAILLPRNTLAWAAWAVPTLAAVVFGLWQMAQPQGPKARVALLTDDRYAGRIYREPQLNAEISSTFTAQIDAVTEDKPQFIILPEKILQSAEGLKPNSTTLVAGTDEPVEGGRLNAARVYAPDAAPRLYLKQRMIPGLEAEYKRGTEPLVFDGIGVAICKDMDFAPVLRRYGQTGAKILLVPAWDFEKDARLHGRMAVVRGVENGFAIARSASQGLMTISDAHGRILAERASAREPRHLVADISAGKGGTLYTRFGDVFAWLALALWSRLLLLLLRRKL
jgi:apolipoprotein N-acyltransferase